MVKIAKLGIMGGTFNPIHIGHLVCAEEARSQYGLDEIIFMPTGLPPHKEIEGGTSPEARYLMTVIATAVNPRFQVSRYELDKEQLCYTVDTVRYLREEKAGVELYFITGADAVLEILGWKDPEELLRMANLIAATRPGYPLDRLSEITGRFSRQDRVKVMEIPAIGVSSSLVRERVRRRMSIRYLVPVGVEQFIDKEGLYRQT
ncbi:nicotinate-nucleotide adenylyltransferase [bacterium BMS3Abin01]|nr:nicotinate-nucleotide adenylyltransferase [bacterium BMS3Abin01]HDZ59474.1 nicotinate-nucleotide adenylyltransferase [Actinomycetota bacterium]